MRGIVASGGDVLQFDYVGVYFRRADLQTGDIAVHLRQRLVYGTPERQKALEDLMAFLVCAAVFPNDFLVDIAKRVADFNENSLDHTVTGCLDLGKRFNRLHPFRRWERHFAGLLVILFNACDLVHELALQDRVAFQITLHQSRDTFKLALDGLLHFVATMREQDVTIAAMKPLRSVCKPARTKAQRITYSSRSASDQRGHRCARSVKKRHGDQEQDEHGQQYPVRPNQ